MCLFSFHIKVTGLKCLQEDATISQVSWDYILQCNIGEVWGRRFSELGCRSDMACACLLLGSTRPPQGAPTLSAGDQNVLMASCLSEHRLPSPAPETDKGPPGCSAGLGPGNTQRPEGDNEARAGKPVSQ